MCKVLINTNKYQNTSNAGKTKEKYSHIENSKDK